MHMPDYVIEKTMHEAAGATANGNALYAKEGGLNSAAIQLSGTFSATVTFEATVDGINWVAILATNMTSGSAATTATAAGIYQIANIGGLLKIRARISAYTSGALDVFGRAQA